MFSSEASINEVIFVFMKISFFAYVAANNASFSLFVAMPFFARVDTKQLVAWHNVQ